MKFYDCTMAPSPRRVRIFLAEKGIRIETVQIDLIAGANLAPGYLAINPRGIVPALELDDGTVITETLAICQYLDALHPAKPLCGSDARSRAVIASTTLALEWDGFLRASEAFRNSAPGFANRGIPGLPDIDAIPALAERGMAGVHRFFIYLDKLLSKSEYAAGNSYSLADITALCIVDFAGWLKVTPTDSHPNVQRWYRSVSSRPSAAA